MGKKQEKLNLIENITANVFNKKENTYIKNNQLFFTELDITIKKFCQLLKVPVENIINDFMKLGIVVNENYHLSETQILDYAKKYKLELYETQNLTYKNIFKKLKIEGANEKRQHRPPVVTILGHVDHGKTTLLDYIRKSKIASGEFGEITQKIGGYQAQFNKKLITFIDTPGHEAFTEMRSRGSQVTDIIILVIGADSGVQKQTLESLDHIKNSQAKLIVAINKIDLPNANINNVTKQLEENGIISEKNSGEVPFIELSAKTGKNVDELLNTILLISEINDYNATYTHKGVGVVIESHFDQKIGCVATILVKDGIIISGDCLISGDKWCKIRFMTDENEQRLTKATPSQPIKVYGLNELFLVGDKVISLKDEKLAKKISKERKLITENNLTKNKKAFDFDDFINLANKTKKVNINLIIIADSRGSLEALHYLINKIPNNDKVKINIIRSSVGLITRGDILLATSNNAIIYAFNIKADSNAKSALKNINVDVRYINIIYTMVEEIEEMVKNKSTSSVPQVVFSGKATVQKLFTFSKVGVIAGCLVNDGKIVRGSKMKVIRDGEIIHEGQNESLKHFKDPIKIVKKGLECGLTIVGFNEFKEGDVVESYIIDDKTTKNNK